MIYKLIKEIPRALILSVAIFLVLLLVKVITGVAIRFDFHLLVNFGYTMLYSLVLYFVNAVLFIYLDKFFEVDRFTKRRVFIGFLGSFIVSILAIFLLRIFEDVVVEGKTLTVFFQNEVLANYLVAIIITFFVTLAFHAFFFYKSYQENKVKQQKIIAGTANAKFESLKNQIDPHFLFNSLNVLSSLIEENPGNAQQFTTSLSKVYRYVLEQKDKELVPLEEELAFAKTYMDLLKMRFENSLFYELPETIAISESKVVPLSLQLLLENTVKHNVVSDKRPLHITIFIDGDYLAVQNDFQKKDTLSDRKGVGLQNIINRYGIITNRKVLIIQTEQTFTVKIPILTKQITIMEANATYNENTAYFKAKKQVEKIKAFYGSLISYCFVIPFLIFINLKYSSGFQWFWFPMFGWGFGLVMKGLKVYGYGSNWEERKIQEILRKEDQTQTWK
ncbi:histidine kinase [Flavobacterium eburneipallidum]|uniref:histidine kinase n=1 Tax=Flavobacterium eburneipallidum TaxID=3003263 RepID=UPI002482C9B3|nr:histidine kinase [Flavobacterium eburneipallidum]